MPFPLSRIVVECAPGLEEVVAAELLRLLAPQGSFDDRQLQLERGEICFPYRGSLTHLKSLKTALAAYLVLHFQIPRPLALLGDQNFRRLLSGIQGVIDLEAPQVYRSFYLSAAGRDSRVLTRLREALGAALGLRQGGQAGDLLLRLRRPPSRGSGWEVLVRLTPRPLATRDWRVCNYEGALNASVARAMVHLLPSGPTRVYLNLACGSGTLLVEYLDERSKALVIGIDRSPGALACARENLGAAGMLKRASLLLANGGEIPLPSGGVDLISADLPFGGLIGSHDSNLELYPRLLRECGRVARPGASLVLISHEIKLLRDIFRNTDEWQVREERQITLSGLHPCIILAERNPSP